MFVVQLASNAWLHPTLGVTTSMAHAHAYDNFPAAATAQQFEKDRAPWLAVSALTPRQRAFYRTAPVTVVPLADLQARMATVNGRHEPGEPKAATPVAETKPTRPVGSGVTRQIYQWTLDNPSATKADALRAFPSANPSTVGVQFGAARRSVQQ